jgi:hypothetical protein
MGAGVAAHPGVGDGAVEGSVAAAVDSLGR